LSFCGLSFFCEVLPWSEQDVDHARSTTIIKRNILSDFFMAAMNYSTPAGLHFLVMLLLLKYFSIVKRKIIRQAQLQIRYQ
jgi:hypothetical protein